MAWLSIAACAMAPKPQSENSAQVTFKFSGSGYSALTFWRKLNDDGTAGKRFSVGGNSRSALMLNMSFKKPFATTLTLDPGTYYLDSFQIEHASGYVVSENKHYAARNGWDQQNQRPYYLSFTVKAGEHLTLPEVDINVQVKAKNNVINRFEFEDPKGIFTVGEKARQY